MTTSVGATAPGGNAPHLRGIALVGVASLLWSTVGVSQQLATSSNPLGPAIVSLIRTGLGGLTLLLIAWLAAPRGRHLPAISRPCWTP